MTNSYKFVKRYRIVYKMPFGGMQTIEDDLEDEQLAQNHIIYRLEGKGEDELRRYIVEEYHIIEKVKE